MLSYSCFAFCVLRCNMWLLPYERFQSQTCIVIMKNYLLVKLMAKWIEEEVYFWTQTFHLKSFYINLEIVFWHITSVNKERKKTSWGENINLNGVTTCWWQTFPWLSPPLCTVGWFAKTAYLPGPAKLLLLLNQW